MATIDSLNKLLKSDVPPNLFFCIRKKGEKITEVYCVYNKKDHKNEKIYNLKDTVKILNEYRKNK